MDEGSELESTDFLRDFPVTSSEDTDGARQDAMTGAVLPDDDPEVLEGMERLRQLREQEGDVPDLRP